jgi:hypothetical protein
LQRVGHYTSFRSYQGRGTLTYSNGEVVECDFLASQEDDGGIELTCTTLEPGIPEVWLVAGFGPRSKASRPNGFVAAAADGAPVAMSGSLIDVRAHFSTGAPSEITYILTGDSRLQRGSRDDLAERAAEFRFAATNLLFDPVFIGEGVGTIPLEIHGAEVSLRQLPDYKDREKALKRSRGVRVTSEIRIAATIGFDAARQVASDLCDLCSLARGTLVNWICCDAVGADGQRAYSYHYPAVSRSYAGASPLIDPRAALELKAFLEACFSKYQELRSSRELRTVVHAMCEARGDGFLDTRSLVCVSLLEHVLGKDAAVHGGTSVLDEEIFEIALPSLTAEVAAVVRRVFPDATDDQLTQMTNHVRGFNWSSPRRRLKRTAARLEFQIPKNEVDAVLATRNDLVHRLEFHTEDRLTEYRRLVWVLDRLVLGLLGYEGVYLDARNSRRARVKGFDR